MGSSSPPCGSATAAPISSEPTAGILTAIGQLTALYGTYGALIGLALMSRSPWLDQTFGTDRLAWAHRWVGFATVWLLLAHSVFTILGWAMTDERSVLDEGWTLLTTYPFVLMTTVGMGMFVAVAVSSVRAARRSISYETWHFIHFYAYLAIALTFAHQLILGADFATDPMARIYWSALYVLTIASIVVFRFGHPIRLSLRHRMRVANVVTEGPGIVSIYVTGRQLDRLPVRAGQYFTWRFLARDGWWRAHPYSMSAAPNGEYLRLTVKDLGDDSVRSSACRSAPGSPSRARTAHSPTSADRGVAGPARRRWHRHRAAPGTPGGAAGGPGDLSLIYRARSWDEVVFRDELDTLASLRAPPSRTSSDAGAARSHPSPLGPGWIRHLVPDVIDRDVYICGPDRMMSVVGRSLRALRVPEAQIHVERFAY